MNAIPVHTHRKAIEVEGRVFILQKFSAAIGLKITKLLISKVLPVFGGFAPILEALTSGAGAPSIFGRPEPGSPAEEDAEDREAQEGQTQEDSAPSYDDDQMGAVILQNLGTILSPEGITRALDHISGEDMDFLITQALSHCAEQRSESNLRPVLNPNGTYGVADVQYSIPLTMRLTCEALLWGLGDFFDAKNLISLLKPLGSSWRSMQKTSTATSMPQWNQDIGSNTSFGMGPTP